MIVPWLLSLARSFAVARRAVGVTKRGQTRQSCATPIPHRSCGAKTRGSQFASVVWDSRRTGVAASPLRRELMQSVKAKPR